MKPTINFLYETENKRLKEITESALKGISLNPSHFEDDSFDVLVRRAASRKGLYCVVDVIPLEGSLDSIVVKMDEGNFEKFTPPKFMDIREEYDGVKTLVTIWGSTENYMEKNRISELVINKI